MAASQFMSAVQQTIAAEYFAAHLEGLSQGAMQFTATVYDKDNYKIDVMRAGQVYATAFVYEGRPFTIQGYENHGYVNQFGPGRRWVMQRPTEGLDDHAEMKAALERLAKGASIETLCDERLWIKTAGKALYMTPLAKKAA